MILDPDRDNGEVGYLEVRWALERVSDGASYRAVATDLPNLTRQGLMKIDKDADRRGSYLGAEAADPTFDTPNWRANPFSVSRFPPFNIGDLTLLSIDRRS